MARRAALALLALLASARDRRVRRVRKRADRIGGERGLDPRADRHAADRAWPTRSRRSIRCSPETRAERLAVAAGPRAAALQPGRSVRRRPASAPASPARFSRAPGDTIWTATLRGGGPLSERGATRRRRRAGQRRSLALGRRRGRSCSPTWPSSTHPRPGQVRFILERPDAALPPQARPTPASAWSRPTALSGRRRPAPARLGRAPAPGPSSCASGSRAGRCSRATPSGGGRRSASARRRSDRADRRARRQRSGRGARRGGSFEVADELDAELAARAVAPRPAADRRSGAGETRSASSARSAESRPHRSISRWPTPG